MLKRNKFFVLILIFLISVPLLYSNRYYEAVFITLGIIAIGKLFWMVVYEYRWRGAGEDYLRYGKKFTYNKYMREVPSCSDKTNEADRKNQITDERN